MNLLPVIVLELVGSLHEVGSLEGESCGSGRGLNGIARGGRVRGSACY